METTNIQKLARVLRVLIVIAFVCNLIALLMVPALALMRGVEELVGELLQLTPYENPLGVPLRLTITFVLSWGWVWTAGAYELVLALFLWLCGTCTAVVLWQARKVLGTVMEGCPFHPANAHSMTRAGICCLVISVAALGRLIWGFCTYKSIGPLLTYNALFVPVFAMAFLLCMVMSALFRQANELKEENDLTI